MSKKKNKKIDKKQINNSNENNTNFLHAINEPVQSNKSITSHEKTQKVIDVPNHELTLELAKTYLNRLIIEYPNKLNIPTMLEARKPTIKEFEYICNHCLGNLSEMSIFLDCNRNTLRTFLKKDDNKEYYDLFVESKYSFNDFAVSKLKENIAGVKVLGYDKLGQQKVYDRPPDTKAIEFALRNNKSFEEWEWQNTTKTQNTNLNIDVNQLIQSQLEKMDLSELKAFTKQLLTDTDIKGLIE